MQVAELTLFWCMIFAYVASFCLHIFGFVSDRQGWVTLAGRLLWIGLAFHTATGVIRWVNGGHSPVTDTYELNLTGTWFVLLVFLFCERFRVAHRSVALVVTPAAFLVLGHGFISREDATPMGPAFDSPWLVVHVVFAWIAFGGYLVSSGAAVLLLLRNQVTRWKPKANIPEAQALDLMSYRFIVLGFINHAVMLVSGAIWAKKLWGRYWSWDALETWSLIAFLSYALYLHVRTFFGWRMRKAAWLAIGGLLVVAVSFWGVEWFAPSSHPGP